VPWISATCFININGRTPRQVVANRETMRNPTRSPVRGRVEPWPRWKPSMSHKRWMRRF